MVIAVTDRKLCTDDFTERVTKLLNAEPFLVILREKDLSDSDYIKLAENIIGENDGYKKILSLNRPEAAIKLGIENVHLTISDIRNGRPDIKRVGVSVHSPDEAAESESLGADYLIAGHIYATDCKKGIPPRGLGFLREVVSRVKIPVFAIGGINERNFSDTLESGASGVCLMSEFMKCSRPEELVRVFV
ncbi:MAG: thiamine phosphate synthase [Clostridium sp.]|nr:thiamine phosphate synthase [Clostridium sp.]MCM1548236.1 thiamine phosphate synthase [Ruminococcus sp.]